MGFEKRRKTYPLDFTGTTLEGLEMTMAGMTIREELEMDKLQLLADATGEEQAAGINKLLEFVASKVVSWNLTENGAPVPVSVSELLDLDSGDFWAALKAWRRAISAVSGPLDGPSSGGERFPVELPPMEVLTPNLPS